MSKEKPLHVRVAEALGCNVEKAIWYVCGCVPDHVSGIAPHSVGTVSNRWLALYDTDWAATGPRIEQFGLLVQKRQHPRVDYQGRPWYASDGVFKYGEYAPRLYAYGETPLIAVCHVIIAMHAAGKLSL